MITFRGKIVYRAIYGRAANQVLMLALVTSNFETSSPSSVDCMLLRHKFTLFPFLAHPSPFTQPENNRDVSHLNDKGNRTECQINTNNHYTCA